VFELVIAQGADVVGVYEQDFYAGTPAVTRNKFGDGEGWYIGAGLDQPGVSWVIRQVLERHAIELRYPDVADLESAERVTPDGSRLLFLLNHKAEPLEVEAQHSGTDLLTGASVEKGEPMRFEPCGVKVLLRTP